MTHIRNAVMGLAVAGSIATVISGGVALYEYQAYGGMSWATQAFLYSLLFAVVILVAVIIAISGDWPYVAMPMLFTGLILVLMMSGLGKMFGLTLDGSQMPDPKNPDPQDSASFASVILTMGLSTVLGSVVGIYFGDLVYKSINPQSAPAAAPAPTNSVLDQ